jgi:hypothetical protein
MSGPVDRRLRLQDVAERVGVSAKTVSNAYRNPGQLRPELRQRILSTATEMGYRGPDPLAAGLRRRVAGPIGVLYANALASAWVPRPPDEASCCSPARPTPTNGTGPSTRRSSTASSPRLWPTTTRC